MSSARNTVLLLAAAAGTVAVYVSIFFIDTTRDNRATLDNEPVKGVATKACTALRLELDALPPLPADATEQQRQDRIAAQDRAVRTLIGTVQAVGEPALRKDVPAAEWLADWATLADARQAYAAAGAAGPFSVPVAEGRPLSDRMGAVGLPGCLVPVSLTTAP
ncbi:MAG TPA: hypothetical protein VFR07_07345 [Mycobacteriales bacterium]|jgi:hypothetical protein|nr:hypothetical protein [Mycobacteriales bacterium]